MYTPHPQYAYGPPAQQEPPPIPGSVTAVRVLMFLGGCLGVLTALAVAVLLGAVMGMSPGEVSDLSDAQRVALEFMADEGVDPEVMAVMIGLFIGVPGVTGLASLFLSAVAGRRSRLWPLCIVLFQVLLALGYLVNLLFLNLLALVPLALCILKICLICGPRARAYYAS
ncbi:hypothetical protein [Nocardiopsis potens]|uniref:hypothetical protein n=1 Tax=Nocardiopsis potens TaxID=1246458 RepID=UPI000347067D|nr:hypothetical protein [Nocardiopsis potens]